MEWTINGPEGYAALMDEILALLGNRKKIALYGDLGAGKTTFAQAFCRALGVEQPVVSPTFSLVNEYTRLLPGGGTGLVRHLDLYRLKNAAEAFDIGIEDFLWDPHYCLIEWPGVVEDYLPEDVAKIYIRHAGDSRRKFILL